MYICFVFVSYFSMKTLKMLLLSLTIQSSDINNKKKMWSFEYKTPKQVLMPFNCKQSRNDLFNKSNIFTAML